MVTADDGTLLEVADIVGREVRDTDLLGHTEKGTLALVLLDADFDTQRASSTGSSPASRTTSSRRRCGSRSAPPAIRPTPSTPIR